MGLTGLTLFSPIHLCAAIMIIPWCDSFDFAEANEASLNATNLMSASRMGWISRAVSA